MTNKIDVDMLLSVAAPGISRWELDNVTYNDRTSNPATLVSLLKRVKQLELTVDKTDAQTKELDILNSLLAELDAEECVSLLTTTDDEVVKQRYIENLARQGALETLCDNKLSMDTMVAMCKLSPTDFILGAKRSQDLINAIRELVIQGENLSGDVPGA
jgi:hypothetical protein